MSQLFDARGNEFQGSLDQIGTGTFTDPRVSSATLNALNAEVVMDINGKAVAVFEIRAAANSATYVFEASVDGTNYYAVPARPLSGSTITGAAISEGIIVQQVVTAAAAAAYAISASGYRRVRMRVSAFVSGSAVVSGRATEADYAIISQPQPTLLHVTATAAVNAGSTATLPLVAGLAHYITSIELVKLYSVIGVAAGAGVIITSTNLPGNPAWTTEQLASAAGTAVKVIAHQYSKPLRSTALGTNTTFVAPAQLQTIWRWNVSYYLSA
jgi:hypothetical protein